MSLRLWLLTVLLVAFAPLVLAHRGHQTLTVVEINASGEVTITHRLTAHETEPELVWLAREAQPSLDDPQAVEALQSHLAKAFQVNGIGSTWMSHDFQGDDVTIVYRSHIKFKSANAPGTIAIEYGLFPASIANFVGLVNVRYKGVTKSLKFWRGDAPKSVAF